MNRARLDDKGRIALPEEALSGLSPNAEFDVVREGNALKLVPAWEPAADVVERLQQEAARLWNEATPEERVKAFREWLDMPRPKAPPLPDEALHRESMYD